MKARRSWRVPTHAGSCCVIRRADLADGEVPEDPSSIRSDIAAWVRDPFHRRAAFEMCEAAFGGGMPGSAPGGSSWLERRIEEAFRQGSLVLIRERRRIGDSGGGGGADLQEKAAGGATKPPPPAPAPKKPEKTEKTWFRARLVDEDGQPMAGEEYILVDTTGAQRQGKLDSNGEVYVPPILPPGDCAIRFPNVHLNPRKKGGS